MEEIQKIHYTAGRNATHCGVEILIEGKDIEHIVIDHIEYRKNEKINGVEKDAFVAIFKKNPYTELPMVLNKVNKVRLLQQAKVGSFDLLTIKDLPVRLTYESTNVGDGLRISKLPPALPKPKAKPEIPATAVDKAAEFLLTGTIEKLRESYTISAEMEKKLMEKCDGLKKGKEEK